MDLKDFTDLGNDIGRRVNDAIYHMNFDQLNRDIRNKVDQAFGDPRANGGFGGLDGKLYHGEEFDGTETGSEDDGVRGRPGRHSEKAADTIRPSAAGVPVISKIPGKAGSLVMLITGCLMMGIFGIAVVTLGILSVTMTSVGTIPSAVLGAVAGGMVIPFLAGAFLAVSGGKKRGLTRRFYAYLSVLKGSKFCELQKLAEKTGKSLRFTAKDLQKMIDKGFFPEGHLDDHRTCFIGTEEMYQQYLQARDSAARSSDAGMRESAEADSAAREPDSRLEQIIREGESYIQTIREANDAIYNKEISEKLYRMERIVKKIFEYVRENPEQADQLRRFTSYYMPTTEKLVNAYREMDEQLVQGENMKAAKREIAQTLDTINEAYEKLYDSMYAEVAMDVSSDIAVLKSLFAQDGLTNDEWNGGKKR